MKKFLLILILLPAQLFAQVVTNVRQKQDGDNICIYYDLSEEAYISLLYSVDGGRTFLPIYNYLLGAGRNSAGVNKKLTWQVLKQFETFKHDDVRFKVFAAPITPVTEANTKKSESQVKKSGIKYSMFNPPPTQHNFYLLADFAWSPAPQYSGGFMLGTVRTWGWYMKLHLSFTKSYWPETSRSSSELGLVQDYSSKEMRIPAYTGKDHRFSMVMSAGFVARLVIPIYAYAGIGYGSRQLYWEAAATNGNYYVQMANHSYRGVAIDAGLMYDIWYIRLKTGVTTINFKYIEYDFGIGYVF